MQLKKKKVTMTPLLPVTLLKERDPGNEIVIEIKFFKRRPGS